MEIWQFLFAKVVQEHTLGVVGSRCARLLEIYSAVTLQKSVDSRLSYYKQNVCSFFCDTV